MADIYTITPGSQVASTVQEILQRRRDEQRQLMLDRLGLEKFRQDTTEQDRRFGLDQTVEGRLGRHTDQQIAESKERVFGDQLKTLGFGEQEMPDEFVQSDLGQELMRRGRLRRAPGPTPTVGASSELQLPENATPEQIEALAQQAGSMPMTDQWEGTPQASGRWMYTGSEKFQEAEDARNRIEAWRKANEDPKNPELGKIAGMQAAGMNVQFPASVVGPAPSVTPITPQGNARPRVDLPRGGEAMELGYPPVGPAGLVVPALYQIYKNNEWVKSDVLSKQEADALAAQGFELRTGNTPVTTTPATVHNELTQAREVYRDEVLRSGDRLFASMRGEPTSLQSARDRYSQALAAVFAYDPAPAEAKEEATFIATDPELSKLSTLQVINHPKYQAATGNQQVPLSPTEVQELDRLLNIARGAQVTAQPPQPAPPTAGAAPIVGRGAGPGPVGR